MSNGLNVEAIHGYVTKHATRSDAGLDTVNHIKAQRHYNQDRAQNKADRARLLTTPIPPEIAAHSPQGEEATPEYVKPHLSGPSVADPMSPQSIAMRGYAAAAGRLASSF